MSRKGAKGVVYCLRNPCIRDESNNMLMKIGCTTVGLKKRMRELFNTSTCQPFEVVCARKNVKDCRQLERDLHKLLAKHRHNIDREFFSVPEDKIKSLFSMLEGDDYYDDRDAEQSKAGSAAATDEAAAAAAATVDTDDDNTATPATRRSARLASLKAVAAASGSDSSADNKNDINSLLEKMTAMWSDS